MNTVYISEIFNFLFLLVECEDELLLPFTGCAQGLVDYLYWFHYMIPAASRYLHNNCCLFRVYECNLLLIVTHGCG